MLIEYYYNYYYQSRRIKALKRQIYLNENCHEKRRTIQGNKPANTTSTARNRIPNNRTFGETSLSLPLFALRVLIKSFLASLWKRLRKRQQLRMKLEIRLADASSQRYSDIVSNMFVETRWRGSETTEFNNLENYACYEKCYEYFQLLEKSIQCK